MQTQLSNAHCKWAVCVLPFLALATACGQTCVCYSISGVAPGSGYYYAITHTEYYDGTRCEECNESASASATLRDNGVTIWSDYALDNLGRGIAEVSTNGYVNLNSGYVISGDHEITGDYEWSFGDSDSFNVPGPPTILIQGYNSHQPTQTHVFYSVSPPVLYSASFQVASFTGLSGDPGSNPSFTFDQGGLPTGTSGMQFIGYMYGYYVTYNQGSVTRTDSPYSNGESWPVPTIAPDDVQTFTLDVFELVSSFNYSISGSGLNTLVNGGTLSVSTDDHGIDSIDYLSNGTNAVSDNQSDYYGPAPMNPPQGPTIPAQSEWYRSLENSWSGVWLAPGGIGKLCVVLVFKNSAGGGPSYPPCPVPVYLP